MRLYFERSNGELFLIKDDVESNEEAYSLIDHFLATRGFRSYYKIGNIMDGYVQIDVGSWSEFFRIYGYEL